jgi:hypothetical protein
MSSDTEKNEESSALEVRADDQRRVLHSTVAELRSKVQEEFNPRRLLRTYVAPISAAAAFCGLLLGYSFTGMFTRY